MSVDLETHMTVVARECRRRAMHGFFDGRESRENFKYIRHCTSDDHVTATRLIFTRDTGHHTNGWWKNPDYERCWHLSTSATDPLVLVPGAQRAELDKKTLRAWVQTFFGSDVRLVWSEPPYSPEGKARGVWHWRVFCDAHWQAILPRGEVYSRELTEAGWRSASEVLAAQQDAAEAP